MCGINGMIGNNTGIVGRMNAAIGHRGPDDTGVCGDANFTIGNNRLAIIDLSPGGHQPMTRGEYSIAYNGELYNFKEIKAELAALGVEFSSDSDTEVILKGYMQWGEGITRKMRGMWAFAILDAHKKTLFLSRDPFGIKPLYLYDDSETIAFSSELRGLLANEKVKSVVDEDALREIILIGFAIAPRTILKQVTSLLPGEEILIDLGTKTRSSKIHQFGAPPSEAPSDEAFDSVLRDSVRHHLVADVPIGLFFSGGTDSTALAILLKELGVNLTAYHVAIDRKDDTPYAEAIAKELGLTMQVVPLESARLGDEARAAMRALDEPIADTAFLPAYAVSRRAAEDVKVVLSGEGGDELFGGYARHRALADMHFALTGPNVPIHSVLSTFPSVLHFYPKLQGLVRLWHKTTGNSLGRYVGEIGFGAPLGDTRRLEGALRERLQKYETPDGTFAFDRLLYLPDVNLCKIDISTMAHSVEGRTPFLDREVWKQVGGAPLTWKRDGGVAKAPLKRLLGKHLPGNLVHRSKTGFTFPLSTYFGSGKQDSLEAAVAWYRREHSGLIPALDSILDWGFENNRELLVRTVGYSLFAIVMLHEWLSDKSLRS